MYYWRNGYIIMSVSTAFVTESMPLSFAVIFPMDLLEKGLSASNFAMLGLGDIVIPGELEWKRCWKNV